MQFLGAFLHTQNGLSRTGQEITDSLNHYGYRRRTRLLHSSLSYKESAWRGRQVKFFANVNEQRN